MLRFFRNIRQKLLENGNLRKYFWYAIGEILLVVIGILIALQINNWNEERKLRNEEITYLNNLKSDLVKDSDQLEYFIRFFENKVTATTSLINKAKAKQIPVFNQFVNEILILLWVEEFHPDQSTYQEMVSSGKLSMISNPKIKSKLQDINISYEEIAMGNEHIKREYEQYLFDVFVDHINWRNYYQLEEFRDNGQLVIDSLYISRNLPDIEQNALAVLSNKRFQNGLFLYEINHRAIIDIYRNTKTQADSLIVLIQTEIN